QDRTRFSTPVDPSENHPLVIAFAEILKDDANALIHRRDDSTEEVNAERSTSNVQLRSARLGLPVVGMGTSGAKDVVILLPMLKERDAGSRGDHIQRPPQERSHRSVLRFSTDTLHAG
ncbi:MAG: hypothetical protein DRJ65_17615, partial [Acidobacteria bacterium]